MGELQNKDFQSVAKMQKWHHRDDVSLFPTMKPIEKQNDAE